MPRLLHFTDMHLRYHQPGTAANPKRLSRFMLATLEKLKSRVGELAPDVVVMTGDILDVPDEVIVGGTPDERSNGQWLIEAAADYQLVKDWFDGIGVPYLVIPGNHEEGEKFEETVKDYEYVTSFNRKVFKKEGYIFLGYGGDGFSVRDPEFRKIAREWYGKYNSQKIVLVTHGPPAGTKLDILGDRHVGNIDYRKFIERIKPKLAISGHLHETAGAVDKIGKTKLVNPCWEGMVIELK